MRFHICIGALILSLADINHKAAGKSNYIHNCDVSVLSSKYVPSRVRVLGRVVNHYHFDLFFAFYPLFIRI